MNLTKLFEAQRVLDERIEKEHPVKPEEDRVAMKILALQVELGECANEWRGFKFWSQNRNPVTKSIRPIFGTNVDGTQFQDFKECNPLLEETVDVLHFILSIGNETGFTDLSQMEEIWTDSNTLRRFSDLYYRIALFKSNELEDYYREMFRHFLLLTHSLGFSWEEIETAYYEKNKINHERQDGGY